MPISEKKGEKPVTFHKGQLRLDFPPTLRCPTCQENSLFVYDFAALNELWNKSKHNTVEQILAQDPLFKGHTCPDPFHGFFLGTVGRGKKINEGLRKEIPTAVLESNPAFNPNDLSGSEREDVMKEHLKQFRSSIVLPLLKHYERQQESQNQLYLSLTPRHMYFKRDDMKWIVNPRNEKHFIEDGRTVYINDVIPIMPFYLIDNSNWLVVAEHFGEVLKLLQRTQPQEGLTIIAFSGSSSINIRSWLAALNFEGFHKSKPLMNWIQQTKFCDAIWDPFTTEKPEDTKTTKGYHVIPSRNTF
jgi:hypothetical protein